MQLRLSTESRFILSQFPPDAERVIREKQSWRVVGDLTTTDYLLLAPVPAETPGALTLAKDGRMFVARGQEKYGAREDMTFDVSVEEDIILLRVTGREKPSPERIRRMLAAPTRDTPTFNPNAQYLFDDLIPERGRPDA